MQEMGFKPDEVARVSGVVIADGQGYGDGTLSSL